MGVPTSLNRVERDWGRRGEPRMESGRPAERLEGETQKPERVTRVLSHPRQSWGRKGELVGTWEHNPG